VDPPARKRRKKEIAGSPANFRRKIEFFVFIQQSGTPEATFLNPSFW
jgi:hypothetical protein